MADSTMTSEGSPPGGVPPRTPRKADRGTQPSTATGVWRSPVIWNALAAIVALATAAVAIYLVVDARTDVSALEDSLASASREIHELRDAADTNGQRVGAAMRVLGELSNDLSNVQSDISSIRGRWFGRTMSLGEIEDELADIRRCVNRYMDTVANAGGGRYTYYWC
jgi:hypothetical protein